MKRETGNGGGTSFEVVESGPNNRREDEEEKENTQRGESSVFRKKFCHSSIMKGQVLGDH